MSKVGRLATVYIKQSLVPSKEFGPIVQVVDHEKLGRALATFRLKKEVEAIEVARKMKRTKGAIYFLERGLNKWNRKKVEDYIVFTTRIAMKRNAELLTPSENA